MLIFVRLVSALIAAIVVVNIAVGAMTEPDFLVPDLVLAALLAVAAALPRRTDASLALGVSLAFALGVFSVALSGQVNADEVNAGLAVLMAANVVALVCVGLILRRAVAHT